MSRISQVHREFNLFVTECSPFVWRKGAKFLWSSNTFPSHANPHTHGSNVPIWCQLFFLCFNKFWVWPRTSRMRWESGQDHKRYESEVEWNFQLRWLFHSALAIQASVTPLMSLIGPLINMGSLFSKKGYFIEGGGTIPYAPPPDDQREFYRTKFRTLFRYKHNNLLWNGLFFLLRSLFYLMFILTVLHFCLLGRLNEVIKSGTLTRE